MCPEYIALIIRYELHELGMRQFTQLFTRDVEIVNVDGLKFEFFDRPFDPMSYV